MTIETAFPDFDVATLPVIPAGFVDASWHNDACPRFENETLKLTLWIDYADVALREFNDEGKRFILTDDNGATVAESNDMADIVAALTKGEG